MLTDEEIHRRHSYQTPSMGAEELHTQISQATEMLAGIIEHSIPEGREKALAHTHLEEVKFWANAAISRNDKP